MLGNKWRGSDYLLSLALGFAKCTSYIYPKIIVLYEVSEYTLYGEGYYSPHSLSHPALGMQFSLYS